MRHLLVVAVLFLLACTSLVQKIVKEPKVTLSGVGLKDVNQNGGIVLVNVLVENPNPFILKIDALKYELEVGGKHLSTGQLLEPAQVSGNSNTVVAIPVPVKFSDLYSSVMDFIAKRTTTYHIKGDAHFGLMTIPFDNTGDLKLDQ
jgi:LEA14-like dessication related protein